MNPPNIKSVKNVVITTDDKYLIIENQIWEVETGEMITTYSNSESFKEIKISPNNKWLATKNEDGIIQVWDLEALVQQNTAVDEFVQY